MNESDTGKKKKRGPGRPSRAEVEERTRAENRPDRVPVSGDRDVTTVMGKDPKFAYRWVKAKSENSQRIYKFKQAGYEHVSYDEGVVIGDINVTSVEGVGSVVSMPTDRDGTLSYLMKIDRKWYDQDQKAKQDKILAQEQNTIKGETSPDNGRYGDVSVSKG